MGDLPFNDDKVYNEFDKKRNELTEYSAFRLWYINEASALDKEMIIKKPDMAKFVADAGVGVVRSREYAKAHPIDDNISESSDENEKDLIININNNESAIEEDDGSTFTSNEEYEEIAKKNRYVIADKSSDDDMPNFYNRKSSFPK